MEYLHNFTFKIIPNLNTQFTLLCHHDGIHTIQCSATTSFSLYIWKAQIEIGNWSTKSEPRSQPRSKRLAYFRKRRQWLYVNVCVCVCVYCLLLFHGFPPKPHAHEDQVDNHFPRSISIMNATKKTVCVFCWKPGDRVYIVCTTEEATYWPWVLYGGGRKAFGDAGCVRKVLRTPQSDLVTLVTALCSSVAATNSTRIQQRNINYMRKQIVESSRFEQKTTLTQTPVFVCVCVIRTFNVA